MYLPDFKLDNCVVHDNKSKVIDYANIDYIDDIIIK
jgi:hypothetical protein